jgi:hypothetical protein
MMFVFLLLLLFVRSQIVLALFLLYRVADYLGLIPKEIVEELGDAYLGLIPKAVLEELEAAQLGLIPKAARVCHHRPHHHLHHCYVVAVAHLGVEAKEE